MIPQLALLVAVLPSGTAQADINTWTKLDKATIIGRRREPPLVYSPELGRFCVLGGLTDSGSQRSSAGRRTGISTVNPPRSRKGGPGKYAHASSTRAAESDYHA